MDLNKIVTEALSCYKKEVEKGAFPRVVQTFHMYTDEKQKLNRVIKSKNNLFNSTV
jgi:hypothetical protein